MLEIRLLGQFDLRQDGVPVELPSRPARTLLAYLVLTLGTRHPREKLAGLLWPDSSERNARKNLRQALWHLRKAIGEARLLVDTTSIGFNKTSDFWLDIGLLENTADQDLETGVSVYEGELLPGFYEDWVLLERDRLEAAYERKMQRLLAQLEQAGRWAEVLDWAERWIAHGHVSEAAYRALMRAHAALGELSKVEAVYQRCAQALRQEIDVGPSEETQQLYESLLAGEKISPYPYSERPGGAASIAPQQVSLPAQPTPFIGRKEELAQIERLLSTTRLLTLTGPGGMGKTRLAIKAAEEAADDFDDGVFFVSLAPIRSVDHLIQTIAEAVNFPLPTHEDPKRQLLRYLQKKNLLLVMDNFEHLLNGVSIVSEILKNTSKVKILATSQERLNLQGETNLHITGMHVGSELDEGKDDAIALFLQSAARAQPGFKPTTGELARITNICQFVGGMPLAIELAASWLYILSVNEINDELKKGLDILETEMRDAPERHRSIRAVFNRSWSLLDNNEQEIFMRLSIFRGGFTRQAAQQVAGASLRQIAGLVNKSILRYDPNTGRFEIHELLRQDAQERLESTPQASDSTKEAYAAYYADFMQDKWKQLRGSEELPALTEIEADIENVRTVWRYYLEKQNAGQLQKFIYGFWRVYWVRGWFRGAIELFSEGVNALVQAEYDWDVQALRALGMASQGVFTSLVGFADEGYKLIKTSIEILERLDNPIELAFAYYNLTMAAYYLNRRAEEKDAAQSYLKTVEASNDKWLLANGLWLLGFAELSGRNYAESKRLSVASLKLYNEINNTFGSAWCFVSLGGFAIGSGDFVGAKKYFTRCLQMANELNYNWLSSVAIKYLGEIALLTNDIPDAQEYLTQSLRIAYDLGSDRDIANHLYDFASLRIAQNKLEEGVELISLLLQQPASHLARAGGGLIRERAKTLLAEMESRLSRDGYEDALKRGELMELDDVVIELVSTNQCGLVV